MGFDEADVDAEAEVDAEGMIGAAEEDADAGVAIAEVFNIPDALADPEAKDGAVDSTLGLVGDTRTSRGCGFAMRCEWAVRVISRGAGVVTGVMGIAKWCVEGPGVGSGTSGTSSWCETSVVSETGKLLRGFCFLGEKDRVEGVSSTSFRFLGSVGSFALQYLMSARGGKETVATHVDSFPLLDLASPLDPDG